MMCGIHFLLENFLFIGQYGQAWCFTPAIPALRRLKQQDYGQPELQNEAMSQKKKERKWAGNVDLW
jgi:hypothetical protein